MKRKFYISLSSCLLGVFAFTATSCEDWLTVYPQDKVVEEEFWEDKNDLEGVRYGAYHQMASTMTRLCVWGDLRSDNYNMNRSRHSDMGSYDTYQEIIQGMPDSSMTVFDWEGVYKTINLCNKVLSHGEKVLAKDAQFTTTEWMQMRAEMKALRALNYFYLIRAFKDVPYTTRVINSDREVSIFGQTNQLEVLDSIILDCESVKGQARNRFANEEDSKGLITNCAIYAMLADMYLWRASLHEGRGMTTDTVKVDTGLIAHSVQGDYKLAAEYADKSLASLAKQNEDRFGSTFNATIVNTENYGLTYCDMIKNDFTGASQGTAPELEAQNGIFREGNSVESILELQFSNGQQKNSTVSHLYGYSTGSHLEVSKDALGQCYGGWGDKAKYDSRMWTSCQNLIASGSGSSSSVTSLSGYYCLKWQYPEISWTGLTSNRELRGVEVTGYDYNNWIIYRMTDVMLIKAEALACLKNSSEAKNIVNAIHRRSYCNYNKEESVSNSLKSNSPADAASADVLRMVMNERQLELIGEGKRWFDLVRYAERNSYSTSDPADERESTDEYFIGNGQTGVRRMVDDYLKNAYTTYYTTLKNRFKNRYGLYCPIYYMDIKASKGALVQNPVWNKSKYDQ